MTDQRPVRVDVVGRVAVITIDNPPVNALSHAVRAGLVKALTAVDADGSIEAAVIACAGRTFVAGADIKEFDKPREKPLTGDVAAALEAMTKPVVAALHGTVFGGGLEIALGCHARVAAPGTRLGQPEVKLGLLPGGGGTQRLPRAVGATEALKMIVSGEPVSAADALRDGLVDSITEGDLTQYAIALAQRLAATEKLRRLRDDDGRLAEDRANRSRFDAVAQELTKRARGQRAPYACVEAVRAALDLPFDAGLERERMLFAELMAGEQSKALRHLFFAERNAARLPISPSSTKPHTIENVAILGAGTMGSGIAMAFADAGIRSVLIETDDAALQRALARIAGSYRDAAKRGRFAGDEAERRIARIEGVIGIDRAGEADLVVEAVFEDMDLKREVFATLDRVTRPATVLATNTSYLDVDRIAEATGRAGSVAGMHFFSPANVMRLVEVVRGRDTTPETLAALVTLARRLGKVPVVVGNGHGFVGNRMLRQRSAAVERVLLEGALPQEVDAAMVSFGFPMGPLAAADLASLDIGWRMRRAESLQAPIADTLCELGRFGQKTGKGFYRYEEGSRSPLPDPEVVAIIAETAQQLGIARRPFSKDTIVERLLIPIINEGARILADGIAARPGDIDVIWVNGYGFPRWRGGPMFYADALGLGAVRERLDALASETGEESLKPAPLIQKLIVEGRTFGSLAPDT
jgi:3-hydroxyacyl-CoA dehydrogenase